MAQTNRNGGPTAVRADAPGPAEDTEPRAHGERRTERPAAAAPAHDAPLCQVAFCPVCTMITAFGEVRPELTEHLMLAGRELLLALRALIDARLEADREPNAADGEASRLERIRLD